MIYRFVGGIVDGLESDLPQNGGKMFLWAKFVESIGDKGGIRVSRDAGEGDPYQLKGNETYVLVNMTQGSDLQVDRLLKDIESL